MKITLRYLYIAFNVGLGIVLVPFVLPFVAAVRIANDMMEDYL